MRKVDRKLPFSDHTLSQEGNGIKENDGSPKGPCGQDVGNKETVLPGPGKSMSKRRKYYTFGNYLVLRENFHTFFQGVYTYNGSDRVLSPLSLT
jgi:hypothetical protein